MLWNSVSFTGLFGIFTPAPAPAPAPAATAGRRDAALVPCAARPAAGADAFRGGMGPSAQATNHFQILDFLYTPI